MTQHSEVSSGSGPEDRTVLVATIFGGVHDSLRDGFMRYVVTTFERGMIERHGRVPTRVELTPLLSPAQLASYVDACNTKFGPGNPFAIDADRALQIDYGIPSVTRHIKEVEELMLLGLRPIPNAEAFAAMNWVTAYRSWSDTVSSNPLARPYPVGVRALELAIIRHIESSEFGARERAGRSSGGCAVLIVVGASTIIGSQLVRAMF